MMIALMAATKDNASHRRAISSPLCMLARAPTLLAVGRLLNFDSRELDVIRSTPGIDLALLRRLPREDKRRLIHDGITRNVLLLILGHVDLHDPLLTTLATYGNPDLLRYSQLPVPHSLGRYQHHQSISAAGRTDGGGPSGGSVPGFNTPYRPAHIMTTEMVPQHNTSPDPETKRLLFSS